MSYSVAVTTAGGSYALNLTTPTTETWSVPGLGYFVLTAPPGPITCLDAPALFIAAGYKFYSIDRTNGRIFYTEAGTNLPGVYTGAVLLASAPGTAAQPAMGMAPEEVVEKRTFVLADTSGNRKDEVALYVRHVPGFPGHLDHCDANKDALIRAYGKDSPFDLTWRGLNYNWHSLSLEVSLHPGRSRIISIDLQHVGIAYWLDPNAKPAKQADGTCPRCGAAGEFIRMALCCPKHGAFGGM